MAEIQVPRAELAELCGLPADTDDETLRQRMADLIAAHEAREAQAVAAAAEAQLVAEDKRVVEAAVAAGKFGPQRKQFWIDACARDRSNRQLIASLAPVLADMNRAAGVDPEAERTHARVMAQLGLAPQPRSVAASGDPFADARERQVLDEVGLPVAQVPPPVLLRKGTNAADYTREQEYQYFAHKFGGKIAEGVPKPPAGDVWYQPSPNDPYRWDESAGRFVEKQPFKEVS